MKKGCLGCFLVAIWIPAGLVIFIFVMSFFNARTGANQDFAQSALKETPPPAWKKPVLLRVVTFNIQDTWVVGQNRPERMAAIGHTLTELDPDLAGFQEAFVGKERAILMKALSTSRLQYSEYYPSGTVGSGLFIMSAFPIKEAYFHRYTMANEWYKVWEGDWWAGKGAALARVELPGGANLDFYTTHAQAGYGNPAYRGVRRNQMAELAQFINESRLRSVPALITGDFNCGPGAEDHETAVMTANMVRLMTHDTHLDHIYGVQDGGYQFEVVETIDIVDGRAPGGGSIRLSDHYGYMSTIRITPAAMVPQEKQP